MAESPQARLRIAALDLQHLRQLQLLQPRMRQIERDGNAGYVVGREPLVREPVMRPEHQRSRFELGVDLRDALLERRAVDGNAQVAETHPEQLLVRPRGPFRIWHL